MANHNEQEFSNSGINIAYYSVDGEGRLYRQATQEEISAGGQSVYSHTKAKGKNAGQIVYRKVLRSVNGVIKNFWVKSGDFGDSLVIELYSNGFTSSVEMSMQSSFASSLIEKINNAKEGVEYWLSPYKIQAKDKQENPIPDKFNLGVSLKDSNDNKVENYIKPVQQSDGSWRNEIQLQLVPKESIPLYKKDEAKQSTEFWRMYFATLTFAYKERVVPANKKRFVDWAAANIEDMENVYVPPVVAVVENTASKAVAVKASEEVPVFMIPDTFEDLPF